VSIGGFEFRAEPRQLFVRLGTTVRYRDVSTRAEADSTTMEDREGNGEPELGRIELVHLATFTIPESLSPSQEWVDAFVERELFYLAVPYVREAVQRYAQEVGLPPTVLPLIATPVTRTP